MRFLLDTNVLSEPLRPLPDPGVLEGIEAHRNEVATACVVWHELWYGAARLTPSRRRAKIERYFRALESAGLEILPYDAAAARWHARERARLSGLGRSLPLADGQIAAIARVNDLTLVTANGRDYQGLEGLRLEDWRSGAKEL
ncbi:MAG: type II toxin-antitoxin system VapC family toxin [Candidatus Sericytochromatia bacterium]|nr:type II toxin-antitoxin system VapC family toxin [Candidatus Tanganyikabacteria bacterium]